MDRTERIGISLDKTLLAEFDRHIAQQNYPNRSEAIRDLVRKDLAEQQLENPSASAVAGIFLVYDHHAANLSRKLNDIQHHHLSHIISSVHIHLDHDHCLEIIILKGKVKDIQAIADKMTSMKHVTLSRMNLLTTGK